MNSIIYDCFNSIEYRDYQQFNVIKKHNMHLTFIL